MPFSAVAAVLADPEGVIAEGSTGAGALVPDPEFPGRRRCLLKGLLAASVEEGQAALAAIPEAEVPLAAEEQEEDNFSESRNVLRVPAFFGFTICF